MNESLNLHRVPSDTLVIHELSAQWVAFNRLLRESELSKPSRMFFYVDFEGTLPPGIPFSTSPIEVSIKLPAQYAAYLSPVLKIISASGACQDDEGERTSADHDLYITFLPLPPTFNHRQQSCWEALAFSIQDWILTVAVDAGSPERTWATDAFWIAYIASYPCFPREPWGRWDPNIPLLGTWGEKWLTCPHCPGGDAVHDDECEGDCSTCLAIREELWVDFQNLVMLFYRDGPIICTE